MSHPWNTDGWLYGTSPNKAYGGKLFRRVGIYTTKLNATKDESRYKSDGYSTHIANVPKKQPYPIEWKYVLYVRERK